MRPLLFVYQATHGKVGAFFDAWFDGIGGR
jgi:hypothetical protein